MFECQCSKSDIPTLCFLDVQRVFLVSAKELFHCLPPLAFFFSSLCLFLLSCTDSKSLQGRGTTYLFIFVLSHCVCPKTLLFLRSNMLLFIMLLLHGFSGGWFEAPPLPYLGGTTFRLSQKVWLVALEKVVSTAFN